MEWAQSLYSAGEDVVFSEASALELIVARLGGRHKWRRYVDALASGGFR
jgi:hypothetical protein